MADRRHGKSPFRWTASAVAFGLALVLLSSGFVSGTAVPDARSTGAAPSPAAAMAQILPPALRPEAASPRGAAAAPALSAPPVPMGPVAGSLQAGAGPSNGRPLECTAIGSGTAGCLAPEPAAYGPISWANESPYLADPSQHPSGGPYASLAYDFADGVYVFFGGCLADECPSSETWIYQAGGWQNVTAQYPGPPARYSAAMDYDPSYHAVLLYGGCGRYICPLGDTWTFNLSAGWVDQTGDGCYQNDCPSPVWGASLVWDPVDNFGIGMSVLFDGCTNIDCTNVANQTFGNLGGYQGVYWSNALPSNAPTPRADPQMAWDPAIESVVLFGGTIPCGLYCDTSGSDTWSYTAVTGWQRLTPSLGGPEGRAGALLTWDEATQEMILAGGYNDTSKSVVSTTWDLACADRSCAWTNLTTSLGGPTVAWMAVAENNSGAAPWYVGGTSFRGLDYASGQYALGLQPTGATATATPDPTEVYNATVPTWFYVNNTVTGGTSPFVQTAYVPEFGYTEGTFPIDTEYRDFEAMNGSYVIANTIVDRYGLLTSDSVTVEVHATPAVSIRGPTVADVGAAVQLTAVVAAGTGVAPFTYAWSWGDGAGGPGGATGEHAYTSPGTYDVAVNLTDYFGYRASTLAQITVVPAPSVSARATPGSTDPGFEVAFAATGAGGVGPYSFAWQFGDGTNGSGPNVTHAYATGGTFTATVTLTDAVGVRETGSVNVTIAAPLAGTISFAPTSPIAGAPLNFTAAVTGGTGADSYAWEFGDGSTGRIGRTVEHTYALAGSYEVNLSITDALGAVQVVHASVTVGSPSSGTSGSATSLSSTEYVVIAVSIAVAAVLLLLPFVRPRRPREPPA